MKGIDISNNNSIYNFNAIKNDGVEVIIMKATEGCDFLDSNLEQNYQGAKSSGISHIGFYHFMSENTSPYEQANDFFNAINGKEYDIIPTLDIETNRQGRSASEITDRCIEFLNRFKELSGLDCMIYTGGYFGRDSLDNRIKGYKGWIAHYGVDTPMETGFTVVGHQYSESGSVSGINGNCDMNNFTEDILINGVSYSPTIQSNGSISSGTMGIVTASTLNVRNMPNGNIIGQLSNGEKVKIDRQDGNWFSIFFGEHGGYVSIDYVNIITETSLDGVIGTVTASTLNVRDSIEGNIIGQLSNGEQVKLCRKEQNWYHIYYGDSGAWVSADYIAI